MALEIKDITLGYKGGKTLVTDLSLRAPEGELIALLGRNGVGKSTLLRVLAGVRLPLAGTVVLDGHSVFGMAAHERARRVAFVTTEQVAVAHLRVREVVAMGRAPYTGWFGTLSPADERIVEESLERVGMSDFRDKPLESLSDGERQRVMIARALAQDTPVMLLDEPTAFLDLPNRYQIALLLRQLAHDMGKTVLFSSHDLSTAMQLCDALWVMSGEGVSAGAPEDLVRSGALEAMFGGTPLTLSPEGVVRLSLSSLSPGTVSGGDDRPLRTVRLVSGAAGTLVLLRRLAERCGFAVTVSGQEGSSASGDSVFAEVAEVSGEDGFGVTFMDSGGGRRVFCADFHALAAALREA